MRGVPVAIITMINELVTPSGNTLFKKMYFYLNGSNYFEKN